MGQLGLFILIAMDYLQRGAIYKVVPPQWCERWL